MPAFRILDPSPVYFLLDGVTPAVGGRLEFYEAGTTTPKDVFGDEGLTVNNGSTIAIGTDGRAVDDIWGDGSYRVRLYAVDNTEVFDRDNVEIPGGTGTAIPALQSGKFLSNDGAVLEWADILQPLDPSGQSGKILGSDGTSLVWTALPTSSQTVTSTKIVLGAATLQWGSGTMPASGNTTASVAVSFSPSFSGLPYHVGVTGGTGSGATSSGGLLILSAGSRSASGFTACADTNGLGSGSGGITSAVPFTWFAIGPT